MAYKIGSSGGGGGGGHTVYVNFTSAQTFHASGDSNPVIFDTAVLDPNSEYNNTTGYFTAAADGVYNFSGMIGIDGSSLVLPTIMGIDIWLDDGALLFTNYNKNLAGLSLSTFYLSFSFNYPLFANDTIVVFLSLTASGGTADTLPAVAATTAGAFMSISKCG